MHMNDIAKYAAEKEHLMRNEGKHPANESSHARAMDPSVSDAYLSEKDLEFRRSHAHEYIDKRYDYERGQK